MDSEWFEEMPLLPPREKLMEYGPRALSDTELLALFLRTGVKGTHVLVLAEQLLRHFGSLRNLLTADYAAFQEISGVGIAKYAQLRAIAELAKRYFSAQLEETNVLYSPDMTREYLLSQLSDEEREIFMVIFLDNRHRVLRSSRLFAGTLGHVNVYPREIARESLRMNAAALILAHNHPSGCPEPSSADREMTSRIVDVCQLFDIRVLDHLVIGRGKSVSFAERGWI